MKCPKCGADNIDSARFCHDCGAELMHKERLTVYNATPYRIQVLKNGTVVGSIDKQTYINVEITTDCNIEIRLASNFSKNQSCNVDYHNPGVLVSGWNRTSEKLFVVKTDKNNVDNVLKDVQANDMQKKIIGIIITIAILALCFLPMIFK